MGWGDAGPGTLVPISCVPIRPILGGRQLWLGRGRAGDPPKTTSWPHTTDRHPHKQCLWRGGGGWLARRGAAAQATPVKPPRAHTPPTSTRPNGASGGGGADGPLVGARPPGRPPQNDLVPTHHRQVPAQTGRSGGWGRSNARNGVVSASASFVSLHSKLKLRRHPPHARHSFRTRQRPTLDNRIVVHESLPSVSMIHAQQERRPLDTGRTVDRRHRGGLRRANHP